METTSVKGISPKRIPGLVQKDVEFAKKRTLGLFKILPDMTVEFEKRRNPDVPVLSVIGPARGFGHEFPETLLMEIGTARARPYLRSKGIGWHKGENRFPRRRRWFTLTEEQYKALAPLLFATLEEMAKKK